MTPHPPTIHMSKDPALVLEGVTRRFDDGPTTVTAVDDLDLAIERGSIVALTGASGSGKSTVLHLAAAMIRPTSGAVRVDGRDITGLSAAAAAALRRQQVGIVFQRYNLVPSLTAVENVTLPLEYAGTSVREARGLAHAALDAVGLPAPHDRFPDELSGGQQQRVAIARALVNAPPILLADEPTGNLDERATRGIFQLLCDINAGGTLVLMATHDLDLVRAADRRVLELRDGRLVYDSAASEVPA